MTLDVLQKEMISAMKNKEKERKDAISSLVSAIKKAAIDEKCKDNITEELCNKVILKEKKTAQEMIDTCPSDRTDLLHQYTLRFNVINEFSPVMMNESEIRAYVEGVIMKVGTDKKNKGQIMKQCSSLKGKADMKVVNQIVTEMLN